MQTLVLTLHIIACVLLVVLVLLQSGKEGMGVIFGGGSASVFGSSGAGGVLVKLTAFMAAVFICTSLAYNVIIAKPKVGSVLDSIVIEEVYEAPVTPPTAPVVPEGITPTAPQQETQSQSAPATGGNATQPAEGASAN